MYLRILVRLKINHLRFRVSVINIHIPTTFGTLGARLWATKEILYKIYLFIRSNPPHVNIGPLGYKRSLKYSWEPYFFRNPLEGKVISQSMVRFNIIFMTNSSKLIILGYICIAINLV